MRDRNYRAKNRIVHPAAGICRVTDIHAGTHWTTSRPVVNCIAWTPPSQWLHPFKRDTSSAPSQTEKNKRQAYVHCGAEWQIAEKLRWCRDEHRVVYLYLSSFSRICRCRHQWKAHGQLEYIHPPFPSLLIRLSLFIREDTLKLRMDSIFLRRLDLFALSNFAPASDAVKKKSVENSGDRQDASTNGAQLQ